MENKTHDNVNHPSHYCRDGAMECIDEMRIVFGDDIVAAFCLCNVWKYRYRASEKGHEEDLKKSDFYMKKFYDCRPEEPYEFPGVGFKILKKRVNEQMKKTVGDELHEK